MKVLVLFALVAFATAKPWWPYTSPLVTLKSGDVTTSSIIPYTGYPWAHSGLYPYPIVAAAKPAEEAARAKRSADPEPEADPWMMYSSGLTYPYTGLSWNYGSYPYSWPHSLNPLVTPARAKRSADPEPEADPWLMYSSGLTYPYSGYPLNYGSYPYSWPHSLNPLVTPARAKRSADPEPEADPWLMYSSGLTYPYSGYPWNYGSYPYSWSHSLNPLVTPTRAKRSADPEPEADPWLMYSSGLTYPYSGLPWNYGAYPYSWPYGMRNAVRTI